MSKLVDLCHDEKIIDLAHLEREGALDDNNYVTGGDEMCLAFAGQNYQKFFSEYNRLIENNIGDILIVRALIRFYMNMYCALQYISSGMDIRSAVSALKPPIFFKYVNDFCTLLPKMSVKDTRSMIDILLKQEILLKQNANHQFATELALTKNLTQSRADSSKI
jgi:DNA polymerase-3 subunit delta